MDTLQSNNLSLINKNKWSELHSSIKIDETLMEPTPSIKEIVLNNKSNNDKILEIGCGYGRNINFLCENKFANEYIEIDQTAESIAISNELLVNYKNKISLSQMDASKKLLFDDNYFDVIIDIMSAITFIPVKEGRDIYFQEVYRTLKPGGIYYFLTSNIEGDISDRTDSKIVDGQFIRDFDKMVEKAYYREELENYLRKFSSVSLNTRNEHYRAFGVKKFKRQNGFWFGIARK